MKNTIKLVVVALLFLLFADSSFSQTIYGEAKSELCIIYSCIPENFTYTQALQEMRIIYSCIPKNFTYTEIPGKMRIIYSCIPPDFVYQSYTLKGFEINETCPPQPADVRILSYDIIPLTDPTKSIQKFRLRVKLTSNASCYVILSFKDITTTVHLFANETKVAEVDFEEPSGTFPTYTLQAEYPYDTNLSNNVKTITLFVENPPNVLKANETYQFSGFKGKIVATVDKNPGSDIWSWIEIEENDNTKGMSIEKIIRQDGKVIERWFRIGNKVYIFDDPTTYTIYYVKPNLPVVAYETSLFIAILISLIVGMIVSLRRTKMRSLVRI